MGHKKNKILVLLIALFLVSIACNLPRADTPRGANIFNQLTQNADHLYCDLIGGQWYLQNPADPISPGRCNEPYYNLNQLDTPYGEKTDPANEDNPQLNENPIQEEVIEAPAEEVSDPENQSQMIEGPSEETVGGGVTTDNIIGSWTGTAQWMCANNAPCQVNLDIKADGTLSSKVACTTMTQQASGNWSLSDDKITLIFDGYPEIWTGTITDNKISGAITGGGGDCDGVWSVGK